MHAEYGTPARLGIESCVLLLLRFHAHPQVESSWHARTIRNRPEQSRASPRANDMTATMQQLSRAAYTKGQSANLFILSLDSLNLWILLSVVLSSLYNSILTSLSLSPPSPYLSVCLSLSLSLYLITNLLLSIRSPSLWSLKNGKPVLEI